MQTDILGLQKQPKKKSTSTERTTADILSTQKENLAARLGAVGAPVDDRGLVGKLLNLEQDQGFFMDVLEVIDRPGQAVKGLLAPTEDANAFEGFLQGLAGQTDRSGVEFLTDLGVVNKRQVERMGGFEKFALNVGVDIITDPLTYLPAGSIKKFLDKINPFEISKPFTAVIARVDEVKNVKKAELDELVKTLKQANPKKKDATILKEAKKQLGIMDAADVKKAVKTKAQQIKKAKDKIDKLKAKGFNDKQIAKLEIKNGGLSWDEWEALAIDDLNTRLLSKADELKVAGNQFVVTSKSGASAPGIYDAEILVDLGDGTFATAARVQIKSTAKGAATGASGVLKGGKGGAIQFADTVELTPEIQTLIQTKYSGINVTVTRNGKSSTMTVADLIEDMISKKAGAPKSYTFNAKNMSPEDFKIIEEAARDVLNAKYGADDFIYIIGKDGTHDIFRWGDIQDNIKVNARIQTSPSAKGKGPLQTRLQIGVDLDRLPVEKSAMESLTDEIFNVKYINADKTVKVGFFDWAATKDFAFSPFAQKVVDFKEMIGRGFNSFFQIGDESEAAFRQLSANSQIIVQDNHRRLMILSEEALKQSPDAEKIIQNMIEHGAQVIDGKVVIETTYHKISEVLTMFQDGWLKAGQNEIPLAIYGATAKFKETTAKNVVIKMNRAVKSVTGIDDAFEIVAKGDEFFLQLKNLSPDELSRLMNTSEFMALADESMSFGRYRPSNEEAEFFLKNENLVNQYRRMDAEIMDIYNKELGIQNIPDAIKTTNGYVRHTLSRQGAEWLKKNQPLAYSKYLREGIDFLATRKYLGTADDINRIMKTVYDIDFDFFDANITNSLADLLRVGVTKNESGKVLQIILEGADDADRPLFQIIDNTQTASLGSNYNYITDFKAEYSKLYENLAPDARRALDNYLAAAGFGQGKAIAIHKSAANMLTRIEKAYVEVPQLLKGYDSMVNWWKGVNLLTPTFHLNNFFGNSVNSFLVGMGIVDQSIYLTRSSSFLRQYDSILSKLDNMILSGVSRNDAIKALSEADREVYEVLIGYFQSGASMKGRGARDLGSIGKTLEEGGQTGLYRELLQANFNLAENADELQRFALYMWAYDKEIKALGGAVDDIAKYGARTKAANKVFESMFDYNHLTRFEQDVMKRMIPFYTFMKNNLVFQMRNIINNPKQYNKLGRAYKYYVSDIAGLTDEDMPEYARNNMWLPIPITVTRGDKETITFLKANLPPAEFGELIESRFARGISSLTIPLKLPIELALNRDIFTGAEIKEFAGQKDRMEKGTGFAASLRDENGILALSGDPTIQKIVNDLGGRVPARYITTALGIVDSAAGYKDPEDAFAEALNSLGILSIREAEQIQVTNLYQALEKYREAEKRWEQATGIDLPSKRELGLP